MPTNISGIAAPPATLQHTQWCDLSRHDSGADLPAPDPDWNICFGTERTLYFAERGNPYADVEEISAGLSLSHCDIWGEPADVLVLASVNGHDSMCLNPDQLAPIAHLLLCLDAEYRGETARAAELMALAEAGVVEHEPDTAREERREAARVAWQEQSAKDEAAKRKRDAVAEAEAMVARFEENLAEARAILAERQAAEVPA